MKPELLLENAILGFIQGISEWLPISSEGLVALVGNLAWGRDFEDAIALALLLHIGTALSAIVYFRRIHFDKKWERKLRGKGQGRNLKVKSPKLRKNQKIYSGVVQNKYQIKAK